MASINSIVTELESEHPDFMVTSVHDFTDELYFVMLSPKKKYAVSGTSYVINKASGKKSFLKFEDNPDEFDRAIKSETLYRKEVPDE